MFPVGDTTVQCTAVDAAGNVATNSITITVTYRPLLTEEPLVEEEQQQLTADEEEAPAIEEQPPPTEEEGAAAPPANDEGEGG